MCLFPIDSMGSGKYGICRRYPPPLFFHAKEVIPMKITAKKGLLFFLNALAAFLLILSFPARDLWAQPLLSDTLRGAGLLLLIGLGAYQTRKWWM